MPFRSVDFHLFMQPRVWLLGILVLLATILRLTNKKRYVWGNAIRGEALLISCTGAFLFYAFTSMFWSPDINEAMPKAFDILIIFLTLICFRSIQLALGRTAFSGAFWRGIMLVAAFLALLTLVSGIFTDASRTNILGGGPNIFGRIMGLLCIASLYYALRKYRRATVLFVIGALLIIISGSRGALLAAIVGCVTFLLVSRSRLHSVFLIVLFSVSLIGIALFYTPLGSRALETFQQRVLMLTFEKQYDAGRIGLYDMAIEVGMESPIFGTGLAAFPVYTGRNYPHNVFLEIFAEGGILGLLLFLAMLGAAFRMFWKNRSKLNPASIAAFVLILVASQFSGDLYDSRGIILLSILAIDSKPERKGKAIVRSIEEC